MPDLVVGDIGTVSSSSSSDSTDCQDLIEATKRHLYTGSREERNSLAADINVSIPTLAVTYELGGIQKGTKLSIGLEDMYVWTAPSTTAITVQRGQFGSTPTAHSLGDTITVNPRFSDAEIFRELNNVLRDLSSPQNGLFQIKTADLTFQAAVEGYDMTGVGTDLIGVYEVSWKPVDISKSWPKIRSYTLSRNMATSEFASTYVLKLYESPVPGRTVRVAYKAKFGLLVTTSDNVLATTGLPISAFDLLPLGAAIRLTLGREVKRNFTESQGDTRRAAEVPAGANLNAMRMLQSQFTERVSAEAASLMAQYPVTRGYL